MRIPVAILLLALSPTLACARVAGQKKPDPATALRDDRLNATLWVQTAAEFRASVAQSYTVARVRLDDALADPGAWPQVLNEGASNRAGAPAIIVDVDETVLDNAPHQAGEIIQGVHQHDEKRWADRWVARQSAKPYPAALEFLQYAAQRGVKVFYVTNRAQYDQTLANLAASGLPVGDGALLVPTAGSDKSSRRLSVAKDHHVLMLIGDDLGDFVSYKITDPATASSRDMTVAERMAVTEQTLDHFGRDWIIIANPVYGSWERALYPGLKDPAAINLRKREQLKAE